MNAAHTATADQYAAATADAARRLGALGTRPGARTTTAGQSWLARQLTGLHRAVAAGTARLCPHIGPAPTVIHAALWDRWHLVCTRCLPALLPDAGQDTVCDRCHHPAEVIHPAATTAGPLILAFGLCTRCTHRTGLATP